MAQLKPPPTAKAPSTRMTYIPPALTETDEVYVRVDKHTRPLERPYIGPYNVIKRSSKYFTIDMNNKHDPVSIDR